MLQQCLGPMPEFSEVNWEVSIRNCHFRNSWNKVGRTRTGDPVQRIALYGSMWPLKECKVDSDAHWRSGNRVTMESGGYMIDAHDSHRLYQAVLRHRSQSQRSGMPFLSLTGNGGV